MMLSVIFYSNYSSILITSIILHIIIVLHYLLKSLELNLRIAFIDAFSYLIFMAKQYSQSNQDKN